MTPASLRASDAEWLRGFGILASRRFTVWALILASAAVHLPPAIDLADRGVSVVGVVGLTLTLAAAIAMVPIEIRGFGQELPRSHWILAVAGPLLALGLLTWMAPDANEPWVWAWPFATLLGAGVVPLARPRRDLAVAAGLLAATLIVLASKDYGAALRTLFATGLVTGTRLLTILGWELMLQLARARHTAADLAVAEERVRFAAELHDVQGHHLQVILLKAQLVERMAGRDAAAAQREAAEIRELATQALQDTRAVVHGYRRTTLATELSNAAQILDAAGISTTVIGDAERVPTSRQELLGRLVREGTTNVLRHSHASHCTIDVRVGELLRVRITNDGVDAAPTASGSGLDGLRASFRTAGGDVIAEHAPPDSFRLEATVHSGETV